MLNGGADSLVKTTLGKNLKEDGELKYNFNEQFFSCYEIISERVVKLCLLEGNVETCFVFRSQ
jgi:hypothetical protein